MAEYMLIKRETLAEIADAIRGAAESEKLYLPSEMPAVIARLTRRPPNYESGYVGNGGVLTAKEFSYVSTEYTPASGTIVVNLANKNAVRMVRIAEYSSDMAFVKRGYWNTAASYTYELDAATAYIRIGFDFTSDDADVVDAMFNGGYTITQS